MANPVAAFVQSLVDFEANYNGSIAIQFTQEHTEIPVFSVIVYLAIVFYVPEVLRHREPFKLRGVFAAWNLILCLFSVLGVSRVVPRLLRVFWDRGLVYTVCENPEWYIHEGCGLFMFLFIYSKIPELLDTIFLVVQKKPVIFLHWFHHCTVLLYCWHAFHHSIGPGIWFAAMNYVVHSIMYLYYFVSSIGYGKLAKKLAPIITSLQLLQMVVGCVVMVLSAVHHHADPASCHVDPANYKLGLAMYFSYLVLFAVLFHKLYIAPKPKARTAAATADGKKTGAAADGSKAAAAASKEMVTMCGVEVRADADSAGMFRPRSSMGPAAASKKDN